MRINNENTRHRRENMRTGVGEQLWAAGVLELSLDPAQRAKAKEALDTLVGSLEEREKACEELVETGNRCLRNGESEENLKELLAQLKEGHDQASTAHAAALRGLKEVLTGKQQALLLAWILGNKASRANYHPIWAKTLAALKKTSLGRHLPCFQSLSASQLDTITGLMENHQAKLDAAQAELMAAAKSLASAEGDDAIQAAVQDLSGKRDALAQAEAAARDAVMETLKGAQRAEVAANGGRWLAPRAGASDIQK